MLQEHVFDTGEIRINYAAGSGEGPPLVLLHSAAGSWRDWLPVLPGLADGLRPRALDLRGHGGSARAAGAYRVADYARDVAAFLRSLDAPAVLVGHSLGAIVATAAVPAAPEAVRALILEDPPLV